MTHLRKMMFEELERGGESTGAIGPTSESSVMPAQSRPLALWGGQGIFYLSQLSGQWMGRAFVACRRRC
jgi:hypothetical protein